MQSFMLAIKLSSLRPRPVASYQAGLLEQPTADMTHAIITIVTLIFGADLPPL
jgi:hypothetical protein